MAVFFSTGKRTMNTHSSVQIDLILSIYRQPIYSLLWIFAVYILVFNLSNYLLWYLPGAEHSEMGWRLILSNVLILFLGVWLQYQSRLSGKTALVIFVCNLPITLWGCYSNGTLPWPLLHLYGIFLFFSLMSKRTAMLLSVLTMVAACVATGWNANWVWSLDNIEFAWRAVRFFLMTALMAGVISWHIPAQITWLESPRPASDSPELAHWLSKGQYLRQKNRQAIYQTILWSIIFSLLVSMIVKMMMLWLLPEETGWVFHPRSIYGTLFATAGASIIFWTGSTSQEPRFPKWQWVWRLLSTLLFFLFPFVALSTLQVVNLPMAAYALGLLLPARWAILAVLLQNTLIILLTGSNESFDMLVFSRSLIASTGCLIFAVFQLKQQRLIARALDYHLQEAATHLPRTDTDSFDLEPTEIQNQRVRIVKQAVMRASILFMLIFSGSLLLQIPLKGIDFYEPQADLALLGALQVSLILSMLTAIIAFITLRQKQMTHLESQAMQLNQELELTLKLKAQEAQLQQQYQAELLAAKNAAEVAAKQAKEAQQKAELASQAKSLFVANMSHELRTPLNAIFGMLQLLEMSPLNPAQQNYVQEGMKSTRHLVGLINDVLDFSRIEAGKLSLEHIEFTLPQLLNELSPMFAELNRQKQLTLRFEQNDPLPDTLLGDTLRLKQVLINLVGNAIKFTPSGEVILQLDCLQRKPEQLAVKFSVTDTGIGIAPEALERLFESFTQADESIVRQYGGTGLGLTISQHLIKLMGSTIEVQSIEQQGSCFAFVLNLERVEPKLDVLPLLNEKVSLPDSQISAPSDARLKDLAVLVVDDSPSNIFLAGELLSKKGAIVTIATNGLEALEQVNKRPEGFDLILMDMQMPEMDGVEATRTLREQGYALPILGLTANAMLKDRQTCLDAGMNGCMTKPFNIHALLAEIAQFTID